MKNYPGSLPKEIGKEPREATWLQSCVSESQKLMQKRVCLQHGVKGTHCEPGLLLLLLPQEACEENGIRASRYVMGENLGNARWKEPERLGADCQKKLSQSGRQGQP